MTCPPCHHSYKQKHIPLAYGLLFGMPGIHAFITEASGVKKVQKAPDNDYALRPCFDEPKPNELTDLIREMISVRRSSDALCNGSYRTLFSRTISSSLSADAKMTGCSLRSTLRILNILQITMNFRESMKRNCHIRAVREPETALLIPEMLQTKAQRQRRQ